MKKSIVFLAAFGMAAMLQIALAGDVTGTVTLKGTPPPETPIDFSEHPECGDLHPIQVSTRRYEVGKNNGLKNVFIYISKGLEGKTFPVPSEPVVIDQTKCSYQPYVVGLMVGQPLRFQNSDPIIHNVHGNPKVAGNDEFNVTQTKQGQTDDRIFTKPEVMVKINCDVHRWMLCYVGVVNNPYYAVSDADGNFKIANLPPGEYTLTAYHVKAHGATAGVSQTIKVDAAPLTANFTVEVPQ